jgi:putative membrane protein
MPADPGVNVFTTFLKGAAMGAANVIPGVSGGTIAFITGIYERLIRALKSFDLAALRMALRFDVRGLLAHIDFPFLAALGAGVVVSILSLAKLFEFLFMHHEVAVWAFFSLAARSPPDLLLCHALEPTTACRTCFSAASSPSPA